MTPTCLQRIRDSVEDYLAPVLQKYREQMVEQTRQKIMRDVIWGFPRYEPYEVAIINSPPFQRLRNIFQTSLALFTYPCSVHSRFEHSLGVATLASRLLDAVEERVPERRNPILRLETRLAALLHDVGHGPLSHSSEKFYESLANPDGTPIFGDNGRLAKEKRDFFKNASASEILTYVILTSTTVL